MNEMKDRTVLITGTTSGIGYATAQALAAQGARLVFTTRDRTRGEATREALRRATGNPNIAMLDCDLASLESIRRCCRTFLDRYARLHVLINNAGVWDHTRRESHDGIENIFATNFLAPFLMTHLLLEQLKASQPSRIITVTSGLHHGTINFDDIEFEHHFSGYKAYKQSKLAVILFTRYLARQLDGTGVTVNCVHPGMVKSNLGRDAGRFSKAMFELMGKPPEVGARTSIYLATAPEVETVTGEYFAKSQIARASRTSTDMALAKRVYELGLRYVGLRGEEPLS